MLSMPFTWPLQWAGDGAIPYTGPDDCNFINDYGPKGETYRKKRFRFGGLLNGEEVLCNDLLELRCILITHGYLESKHD